MSQIGESILEQVSKQILKSTISMFSLQLIAEVASSIIFENKDAVNKLFDLISNPADSDITTAATTHIRGIASLKYTVREQVLDSATTNTNIYLIVLKKLTQNSGDTSDGRILSFLLQDSLNQPEDYRTVGETIANLISFDFSNFDTILTEAKNRVACATAINLYMLHAPLSIITSCIPKIAPLIDTNAPLITHQLLINFKEPLRFSSVDSLIASVLPVLKIRKCTTQMPQHFIKKAFGPEFKEIDIGAPLHTTAVFLLSILLPANDHSDDIIPISLMTLEGPSPAVKQTFLKLICKARIELETWDQLSAELHRSGSNLEKRSRIW
jgi:hypothetical protein